MKQVSRFALAVAGAAVVVAPVLSSTAASAAVRPAAVQDMQQNFPNLPLVAQNNGLIPVHSQWQGSACRYELDRSLYGDGFSAGLLRQREAVHRKPGVERLQRPVPDHVL